MSDVWVHRLSEYIDDELASEDRADLEAHLSECHNCSHTLRELRAVVESAGTLEDHYPPRDLWEGIAQHVKPLAKVVSLEEARPGAFQFSAAQLLAACLAIMVFSGAMGWILGSTGPADSNSGHFADESIRSIDPEPLRGVERQPDIIPVGGPGAATVAAALRGFDKRITALQDELRARAATMDPETLANLADSIVMIDDAIDEARVALRHEPESEYLLAHLTDSMLMKVRVLTQATQIPVNKI